MYAAGGNAEAARLAGVRVNRVRILTFVLSGGVPRHRRRDRTSRVLSAQSSSGETWPSPCLPASSWAAPASSAVRAPSGAPWSGVLFIALIGNGYDLLGLNSLYEQITLGVIMLLAVGIDAWARGRGG